MSLPSHQPASDLLPLSDAELDQLDGLLAWLTGDDRLPPK
jgi:hypothetical protein